MRNWLVLACALVVVAIVAATLLRAPAPGESPRRDAPRARPGARPNVILYVVDTLRADHLGIYGYSRATSPVIDRWAAEAVVFERAYAPSSWTRPSMVSLFSGLDPIRHGVEDRLDVIPADVALLSERLAAGGYATYAAVTNPQVLPTWGFGRGFDAFVDLDSDTRGTRADAVSDWAVERMGELAGRAPFFLYLHLLDPHLPYAPPAPYDELFPRTPALAPDWSTGRYDGEIAFVDLEFGRILDALRRHGLEDDTLVILVADHGEELLDHGLIGHGANLFEEVVRVPLIVRFPDGAHAGRRLAAPVSLIDVAPTVLAVAGQQPLPGVEGRDLTALLDGDAGDWTDRELFLSLHLTGTPNHLVRGVLSGSKKYLRRSRPAASETLFDLDRDPGETRDLAASEDESRSYFEALLDTHVAVHSSGIHLRIVNDLAPRPVGCEVVLRTEGRFVDVAPIRLEPDDRLELAAGDRTLRMRCQLENRPDPRSHSTGLLADEDGFVFRVAPPEAPVVVRELLLSDDRELPLEAGPRRAVQALPFSFVGTDPAWSVRDIGALLSESGTYANAPAVTANLAVVAAPDERDDLSPELRDRLRALGYLEGEAEEE